MDHLYAIDPAQRDRVLLSGVYVYKGIAGYVYAMQVHGSEPLDRRQELPIIFIRCLHRRGIMPTDVLGM